MEEEKIKMLGSECEEEESDDESGEDFTYPEDMKNSIITELLKRQEKLFFMQTL